eukprot:4334271-Pyramimonas_sp.AAC.1
MQAVRAAPRSRWRAIAGTQHVTQGLVAHYVGHLRRLGVVNADTRFKSSTSNDPNDGNGGGTFAERIWARYNLNPIAVLIDSITHYVARIHAGRCDITTMHSYSSKCCWSVTSNRSTESHSR